MEVLDRCADRVGSIVAADLEGACARWRRARSTSAALWHTYDRLVAMSVAARADELDEVTSALDAAEREYGQAVRDVARATATLSTRLRWLRVALAAVASGATMLAVRGGLRLGWHLLFH